MEVGSKGWGQRGREGDDRSEGARERVRVWMGWWDGGGREVLVGRGGGKDGGWWGGRSWWVMDMKCGVGGGVS